MKQKKSNLSSRFENYTSKAPEGLLHDVKAEMERRHLSVGRPYLRENRVELKRIATIAVAAAVALTVVMVWRHGGDDSVKFKKAGTAQVERASHSPLSPPENAVTGNSSSNFAPADVAFAMKRGTVGGELIAFEPLSTSAETPADAIKEESEIGTQQKKEQPTPQKKSTESKSYHEPTSTAYVDWNGNLVSHSTPTRLSISAYYGSGGNTASRGSRGVMMSAKSAYGSDINLLDMEKPQLALGSEDVYSNVEHHHPIRAGVSVHWRINKRWGVGTGLTYSYLKTDYERHDAAGEVNGTQHLHYLGIPLNVDFSIWQNRHVRVYVTGGGEAQKLVKGRRNETYSDGEKDHKKVKESRMQWSVNAAAGAEYNFTPNLGVYVEPGVDYHFKNGSSVENYYKHKPTSFSLNLGLRWNIK
ncbi:MAG: outer membrane beta-barrel protein [Prevotella sp.]|jgi:opacity protein-like surface antigen